MKRCSNCGEEKKETEFYKRKLGTYHSYCKRCLLTVQTNRWKARKLAAVLLFGGACTRCGYNKNLAALEFHHLDPAKKEYVWGKISKRPWDEVLLELKKCSLLCSNCHAEFHHPEMDFGRIDVGKANRNLDKDRIKAVIATGICPVCNREVFGTKYCSVKCAHEVQKKIIWPSKESLAVEMKDMSWRELGIKYGVSDSAVKKWAKKYGLR